MYTISVLTASVGKGVGSKQRTPRTLEPERPQGSSRSMLLLPVPSIVPLASAVLTAAVIA